MSTSTPRELSRTTLASCVWRASDYQIEYVRACRARLSLRWYAVWDRLPCDPRQELFVWDEEG